MAKYWGAIYKAWEDTIVTEHEYFVAPAIYTPELVKTLGKHLADAEALAKSADPMVQERVRFTRLGYSVLSAYTAMVRLAATEVDYGNAVTAGKRGLESREKLTDMNPTFTTYRKIGEHGYAWWPGEVKQYEELLPFVDGTKGTLIAKLPLTWAFRRDEKNVGAKAGWAKQTPDLKWWKSQKDATSTASRQANPGQWEEVRSDLYLQAQGLVTPDAQSWTGHGWYHTTLELTPEQAKGPLHLKFPGIFNECWLYVNGEPAGHRPFKGVWWMNDYRFEWDADLAGKLHAGTNTIVVRINNPHHMGGMFRRPFVYRAK